MENMDEEGSVHLQKWTSFFYFLQLPLQRT